MVARTALLALGLAACGFDVTATGDGGIEGDAADGALPPDGCTSFSTLIETCGQPAGGDLAITSASSFDTDSRRLTIGGGQVVVTTGQIAFLGSGTQATAIFVHDLSISATLHATGTQPFAIVATGTITITGGTLDVASGAVTGAASRTTCPNGAGPGENDSNGAAGGGGAGLGALGGKGGNGNNDTGQTDGGVAGMAIARPADLIGGCPGGGGGSGDSNNEGGAGGAGGGAIFVVAATSISLAANSGINAGGAGGKGGEQTNQDGDAGGGGGGSGGMIIVETPRLTGMGILSANGGGGGEGSGNSAMGRPGNDAVLGTAAAAGGTQGSPTGADGAAGGNRLTPTGSSPSQILAGGGGGGGGGVGFIRVISPINALASTNISPASSN